MNLFNRTDCCGNRLSQFRVSVYDGNPDDGGTEVAFIDVPGVVGANISLDFGGVVGDFIRVAIDPTGDGLNGGVGGGGTLSLAEVQVMGTSASLDTNINLATGGTATQSTTRVGSGANVASAAIDGNTNGTWGANTTTHTLNQPYSWWQVDLGESGAIDEVVLHNRADCCGNRLAQSGSRFSTVTRMPAGPK